MSDIYEEYGLELETDDLLPEGYGNPDKTTGMKKHIHIGGGGWLKAAIALVLGAVIALGGIFAGGYLALRRPVRPTIELLGKFTGLNYEETVKNKLLSEEYENKTILEIVKELGSVVTDKNLAGINRVVPAFGDYIGEMIGNMNTQFGLNLDSDAMINTEFAELPNYLGETFRTTPLGNILKATAGGKDLEPLLMEICYGQEGLDYTIDSETGEIIMLNGKQPAMIETFAGEPTSLMNNISLASVVSPKANDPLMMSMCYGLEGTTYNLVKDESGNAVLDSRGCPEVTMLPMYFVKTEDGIWTDYSGKELTYLVSEADANGFVMITKTNVNGDTIETYYAKETNSDGKFYAYKEPADGAEAVLFKKTMIGSITENSANLIDGIMLKDAMNIYYLGNNPAPHKIMFSLAYGREGVDYIVHKPNPDDSTTWTIEMINGSQPRTIGDLRGSGTNLINDIAISDIMSVDHHDALTMYMLYGKEGIHYELDAEDNIIMLQRYIAISDDFTRVYNEYGELLHNNEYTLDTTEKAYTDYDGNVFYYAEPDPVKTITANDGTGEIRVYYLNEKNGTPAMYTAHTLGFLAGGDNLVSNMTNRLTVSEIFGEESVAENKLLKHLKDSTVTNLPNEISNLKFCDVFEEEIFINCTLNEGAPFASDDKDALGNPIMVETGDWYYVDKNGKTHRSDTEKAVQGTWKYLLMEDGVVNTEYKVTSDMNQMIANMTANMQKATLNDLKTDGIMSLDDATLNTPIRTVFLEGTIAEIDLSDELRAKGFEPTLYPTLGTMKTDIILTYMSVLISAMP
ncbi:MAG: hypothetical protein E7371_04595 [Clostridiales bacterium]|nr:hypothetical protein [Clostridiales bacterium]